MRAERRSPRRVALGTVLVVDDAPLTRRILRSAFEERGFAVVEATDRDNALEACRHESPDIIVLDLDFGSGEAEGVATLQALQDSPRTARTPVLVFSGEEAHPEEVVERVEEELAERARQRELEGEAQVGDEDSTDPLTALGNGQALADELARMGDDAMVNVFIVDLDHFKAVNATSGHLVGDAVLRIAARRLATIIGGHGVLVRWGGEEFLAVVPDASGVDPEILAERMRCAISDTPFTISADVVVTLTACVGGSSTSVADFDRGIERADAAVYGAKVAGRNSVAFT